MITNIFDTGYKFIDPSDRAIQMLFGDEAVVGRDDDASVQIRMGTTKLQYLHGLELCMKSSYQIRQSKTYSYALTW